MSLNARSLSRRRFVALSAGAAAGAALAVHDRGAGARAALQSGPGQIPTTLSPHASPEFKKVAKGVMKAMAEGQVPGALLGIYHDGKTETAAFGVTDITTGTPVTLDTRFEMGSITKTYTATAIMRLIEQGAIDLEAPVRTYVPELKLADRDVAERVTIKHLLTHSEGWYGDILFRSPEDVNAIAWLVDEKLPTLPQVSKLGQFYAYNNSGFVLLGRVIELVTGKSYRQALSELVLDPLDLASAAFGGAPDGWPYAQSHNVGKNGVQVVTPLQVPPAYEPTGGLWTAIDDQLRYAAFHLGQGPAGAVLNPESLKLMQTPQIPITGRSTLSAGMNWLTTVFDGHRIFNHAGQTFGQSSILLLIPDQQFAVALLTNTASPGDVESAAQWGATEVYLGFKPTPGEQNPPTLTADQLAEYAGTYEVPDVHFTLRVETGELVLYPKFTLLPDQEMGSLLPELPASAPVTFVNPDSAVAVTGDWGIPFAFVRDDDGTVGWLTYESKLFPRVGSA